MFLKSSVWANVFKLTHQIVLSKNFSLIEKLASSAKYFSSKKVLEKLNFQWLQTCKTPALLALIPPALPTYRSSLLIEFNRLH